MRIPVNEALTSHLPVSAVDAVCDLIRNHRIQLHITRQRITKLGDFRPAKDGRPNRLSINGNLNRYEFLLVFLHELAHFYVYEKFGNTCRPHGPEWKHIYGELIREYIGKDCFHPLLREPLMTYSYRTRASGVASMEVAKVLRQFDDSGLHSSSWQFLDELPVHGTFQMLNGRTFQKGTKNRSRYRCRCLCTRRDYLIHREAKVLPVTKQYTA